MTRIKTTKAALLFVLALLQPAPAFGGDDWYRIGPEPPYGYGYSQPGSYTNSPDRDWPAIHSIESERSRHDTGPAANPDRAPRTEPERSRPTDRRD